VSAPPPARVICAAPRDTHPTHGSTGARGWITPSWEQLEALHRKLRLGHGVLRTATRERRTCCMTCTSRCSAARPVRRALCTEDLALRHRPPHSHESASHATRACTARLRNARRIDGPEQPPLPDDDAVAADRRARTRHRSHGSHGGRAKCWSSSSITTHDRRRPESWTCRSDRRACTTIAGSGAWPPPEGRAPMTRTITMPKRCAMPSPSSGRRSARSTSFESVLAAARFLAGRFDVRRSFLGCSPRRSHFVSSAVRIG